MLVDCTVGDGVTINSSQCNESTIDSGAHVGPFAYIRPNCHVGADVKVGDFVELKNSTIGAGTKISHLTYVGDADVGEKVNFGCGTVLVNYDGNRKYRSTIGITALSAATPIWFPLFTSGMGLYRSRLHHYPGCGARCPGHRPGQTGGKARMGRRPPE